MTHDEKLAINFMTYIKRTMKNQINNHYMKGKLVKSKTRINYLERQKAMFRRSN